MTGELIKNRDIVVVGLQPWDIEIGSNCKNIALEFSKHNRVLYVNYPLDINTFIKHKKDPKIAKRINVIKGKEEGLANLAPNLWNLFIDKKVNSINWIKPRFVHNLLNRINNSIFARSISIAIEKLGFKDIILFNDNDIFRSFYLKDYLKPEVSIYYSRDYLLAVDYWKHHGNKMEPRLIAKSDLCVANSTYLAEYCLQFNPNSFYVGQGCDLELFNSNTSQMPKDIAQIKGPILGYVGALQSIRLDIDLITYLAENRPDWSIVLVGPEDEEFKTSSLHRLKNVHFLGSKDASILPQYIQSFDVCFNPQLVNQVTIGNYPRKIDEYLAMGKPVLATKTKAMEIFNDQVYIAETKQDYLKMLDIALKEDSDDLHQQRKAFAGTHSWENNTMEIYKAISTYYQNRPTKVQHGAN